MYKNKFILKLKIFLSYILSFYDLIPSFIDFGYLFFRNANTFLVILASKSRLNFIKSTNKNNLYKNKNYSFIFLCKHTIFTLLVSLIIKFLKKNKKYKFITIISDEKEKIGTWDFHLEWNNHQGVKASRERAIFASDDITLSRSKQPSRLYLPILSKFENRTNYFKPNNPVFIGIMKIIGKKININEINAKSLENDITDHIATNDVNYFARNRLISRLYFVSSLKSYFGDWFELKGIGWEEYNLNAANIGYSKSIINKKYRDAGICLDFLVHLITIVFMSVQLIYLIVVGFWLKKISQFEEVFGINFAIIIVFRILKNLKILF